MKNNNVNIFFACDDNYIPFLAVTIESLKAKCNKKRDYQIYVLNAGIKEENINKIQNSFNSKNFNIEFCDVTSELNEINERLHTRDYYSKSTYYRLFIPTLFPKLDKALYLDCDIILNGDISILYDTYLGNNLVGGVHDSFVSTLDQLKLYVEKRICVKSYKQYFNAGVLLMNLKELRKFDFKNKFLDLLVSVKFDVAQDQDYLNALCSGRVKLIGEEWNFMPLENKSKSDKVKLIHFNLDYKPWQREGILYEDLFWHYAQKTLFLEEIQNVRKKFSPERIKIAKEQSKQLVINAYTQALNDASNEEIQNIISSIKNRKAKGLLKQPIEILLSNACENLLEGESKLLNA